MATESTEMYLAAIYRLTLRAPHAKVSDIAASLRISLPSVSEKVKHLAEQGLVVHKWREGVSLTGQGRKLALAMLRKRRLIETFLVRMADYSLHEVDSDACRLEHAVSDRLADRLDVILEHPVEDPHGHPIPTKDGQLIKEELPLLSEFGKGESVICRQLDCLFTHDQLRLLCDAGVEPGAELNILEIGENGNWTLDINGREVVLPADLIMRISVCPRTSSAKGR
jgi:DtxR family Mn-dependent transcriptional regulator